MLLAITTAIGHRQHTLKPSKQSSGGKYLSMTLDMVVDSEKERNELFASLCGQPAIRMVI